MIYTKMIEANHNQETAQNMFFAHGFWVLHVAQSTDTSKRKKLDRATNPLDGTMQKEALKSTRCKSRTIDNREMAKLAKNY